MLLSFGVTKLHSPTLPLAKPTANNKSFGFRNDGAIHRMYWYLVSEANNVAVVPHEISNFISEIEKTHDK